MVNLKFKPTNLGGTKTVASLTKLSLEFNSII